MMIKKIPIRMVKIRKKKKKVKFVRMMGGLLHPSIFTYTKIDNYIMESIKENQYV